jgi:hypothetical protein
MNKLVSIAFLLFVLRATAQEIPTYAALLNTAEEVLIPDSLHINAEPVPRNQLDTLTVKKWFSNVLPATPNNRLKNRNYYLTGKITQHKNFDLLLLLEEKKKNDSTGTQVHYLFTCKKDGTFIAMMEAAVSGIKKKSNYNTSSWLYKDNKLVLSSRMTVNEKFYDDLMNYKINNTGRFILYPKY